jgi:hypothetical protein
MDDEREAVQATVELTGNYQQISELIGDSGADDRGFQQVVGDLETVLETLIETEGATKSRLVEELPATMEADLDGESVIHVLRLLELYDMVTLDENTWRPGREAERE